MRTVVLAFGLMSVTACVGGGASSEPSSGSAGQGSDGAAGKAGEKAAAGSGGSAAIGGDGSGTSGHGGSGSVGGVGGTLATNANAGAGGSAGQAQAAGAGAADYGSVPSPGARDSHFPLVAGARWTYHHSGGTKAPWDETDTMAESTYQGQPAFVFEDQEDAQGAQTHSTLVVQGTGVYRAYKEITVAGQTALKVSYDPAFLRYDEGWLSDQQQVTLDDMWVQTCVFSSVAKTCGAGAIQTGTTTHVYTVLSTAASVTVPAGTFDAVKIQRVDPNKAETKLYWFAKGVGKVRDESPASGVVSELTSYNIP